VAEVVEAGDEGVEEGGVGEGESSLVNYASHMVAASVICPNPHLAP